MTSQKNSYSLFSGNDSTGQSSSSENIFGELCPKLTYKQRIIGFCVCAGIGWFISFMSFIAFFQGELGTFAIIYTIGNIIAVMSTCFLSGPAAQAKKMVDKHHYISTIIFGCSMIFTIICATVIDIGALTLLSALVQFCAYVWYTLSFIPYGQTMLKKTFQSCCDI